VTRAPLWQDSSVGAKKRVAHYLATEVGEGNVFSFQDVRRAIPNIEQLGRRMRELREVGWRILSYKDTTQLQPDELLLHGVGERIWEPGYRWPSRRLSAATRRKVFERDGQRCMVCGIDLGAEYPDRLGVVARPTVGHWVPKERGGTDDLSNLRAECHLCNESSRDLTDAPVDVDLLKRRIRELTRGDKQLLASWMLGGRRTFTKPEQLWAEYNQLSQPDRDDVREALSASLR
jgi:5-methylcytosine-specific restriction endonuclease McrA